MRHTSPSSLTHLPFIEHRYRSPTFPQNRRVDCLVWPFLSSWPIVSFVRIATVNQYHSLIQISHKRTFQCYHCPPSLPTSISPPPTCQSSLQLLPLTPMGFPAQFLHLYHSRALHYFPLPFPPRHLHRLPTNIPWISFTVHAWEPSHYPLCLTKVIVNVLFT